MLGNALVHKSYILCYVLHNWQKVSLCVRHVVLQSWYLKGKVVIGQAC